MIPSCLDEIKSKEHFSQFYWFTFDLLLGIAKTGGGKTLAFLLPMYRHVFDQPELDREDGPIGNVDQTKEQFSTDCRK